MAPQVIDHTAPRHRSGAVDAVRVVGIIAVIAGHTLEPVWPVVFYAWHVPLFFFLAGYFFSPGRPAKTEFWNRVRTLVRPYLSWLAIFAVPYVIVSIAQSNLSPGQFLGPIYGGAYAGPPSRLSGSSPFCSFL